MSRLATVCFEKVTCTVAQDLFFIKGATGRMLKVKSFNISDVDGTLPTAQSMAIRVRFLPATVTPGTVGAAYTPLPIDPGDTGVTFTARTNDTSKATTSGTAVILYERGDHLYSGVDYTFPVPPVVGVSEALVIELITAPGAAWILSGTCVVEEIGG